MKTNGIWRSSDKVQGTSAQTATQPDADMDGGGRGSVLYAADPGTLEHLLSGFPPFSLRWSAKLFRLSTPFAVVEMTPLTRPLQKKRRTLGCWSGKSTLNAPTPAPRVRASFLEVGLHWVLATF